jgi:nitrate/nitrite transport system permease protein
MPELAPGAWRQEGPTIMAVKERALRTLDLAGLSILEPLVRLLAREDPRAQLRTLFKFVCVPILAFALFLATWAALSQTIVTKYGTLPTPAQVWHEAGALIEQHHRSREAAAEFYEKQAQLAAELRAVATEMQSAAGVAGPNREEIMQRARVALERADRAEAARYSSSPTYIDQILTSLKTVFAGFMIASLVGVPLGILCGVSGVVQAALAPLIQIFKPVSPLAWLPLVMIVVGAVYTTEPNEAWFEKSFISSALTVALCSVWPTLTNTSLGVASIEKDHLNVARVLRLSLWSRVRKIIVPSALPLIFAGLRISLGVGWMVLIAAEMLAQNPGLGKFVWDMFQNGSSQTLAQIMVAVFTIGIIGFFLDRIMIILHRSVSYSKAT